VEGRGVRFQTGDPGLAILHDAGADIHQFVERLNATSDEAAEQLLAMGMGHSWKVQLAAFVQGWQHQYDQGPGSRDGMHGFVHAFLSGLGAYAARAKAWDLRRQRGELVNPTESVPATLLEALEFMRRVVREGAEPWLLTGVGSPALRALPRAWIGTTPEYLPYSSLPEGDRAEDRGIDSTSPSSAVPSVTGCIVVRNEAHLLDDALASLAGWTTSTIVVDNGSTDNTVEMARRFTDLVLSVTEVVGHMEAVRFAVADQIEAIAFPTRSQKEWLFFLDADERVPGSLAKTLRRVIAEHGEEFDALYLPFKWYFCGKWMEHSGWWPGYKAAPQLVKCGAYPLNPHVHWGGYLQGRAFYLPADDPGNATIHYSINEVGHMIRKENRASTQEHKFRGESEWEHSWQAQMAHFVLEWQDAYDTCQGHLDGMHGFVLSLLRGIGRYFVRSKLWDYRQQRGKEGEEALPTSVLEVLDFLIQVHADRSEPWLPYLSLSPLCPEEGHPAFRRPQREVPEPTITPPHLGGHNNETNMDEPILDYLIARYAPKSFLDVGCGPGGMVAAARKRGLVALGIDGDNSVKPDVLHDYTKGPMERTLDLPSPVLVWCVEFVEHVKEAYLLNVLDTFRRADVLFLTHALPGQGGYHHVNEQLPEYWIDAMDKIGFGIEKKATTDSRSVAINTYTKRSGLAFTKCCGEPALSSV
jgi:hypothetical protein